MLAQLNGNLTRAEQLYLENGEADKAVDMYINLNKWEDAIRITQRMVSHLKLLFLKFFFFQFGDYVSTLCCLVIHFMFFIVSALWNDF